MGRCPYLFSLSLLLVYIELIRAKLTQWPTQLFAQSNFKQEGNHSGFWDLFLTSQLLELLVELIVQIDGLLDLGVSAHDTSYVFEAENPS